MTSIPTRTATSPPSACNLTCNATPSASCTSSDQLRLLTFALTGWQLLSPCAPKALPDVPLFPDLEQFSTAWEALPADAWDALHLRFHRSRVERLLGHTPYAIDGPWHLWALKKHLRTKRVAQSFDLHCSYANRLLACGDEGRWFEVTQHWGSLLAEF
eukprot:UN5094